MEVDMLMFGLKGTKRDWRKASDLYYDAKDEGDLEAMVMVARICELKLIKKYQPGTMSNDNSHQLTKITREVRGDSLFANMVYCLGKAAAGGWVSSNALDFATRVKNDRRVVEGMDGGQALFAAVEARKAEEEREELEEVRERIRARERQLRERAVKGVGEVETIQTEGNQLFKNHRYAQAAQKYSEALDTLEILSEELQDAQAARLDVEGGEGTGEERHVKLLTLRAVCLSNRAQCMIQEQSWRAALRDLERVEELAQVAGVVSEKLEEKNAIRREQALDGLEGENSRRNAAARRGRRGARLGAREEESQVEERLEEWHVGDRAGGDGASGAGEEDGAAAGAEAGARVKRQKKKKGKAKEEGTGLDGAQAATAAGARAGEKEDSEEEAASSEEEDSCPVCLAGGSARLPLRPLPQCRHLIHARCYAQWTWQCRKGGRDPDCPFCRRVNPC